MLKAKIKALNNEKKILEEKVNSFADENISLTSKLNEVGVILKNKAAEIESLKKQSVSGQPGQVTFNEEIGP